MHIAERVLKDEDGNRYEFGHYYDLPDHPGCQFLIRIVGNHFRIEYIGSPPGVCGQPAAIRIRRLSSIYGHNLRTEPILRPYHLAINAVDDAFPIAELVEWVMHFDIEANQITPIFDDALLVDHLPSSPHPDIVSDGEVYRNELPPDFDQPALSRFTIEDGATWAIQFSGNKIEHVYLWMGAAKCREAVLSAIEAILANQLTPHYL